MSKQKKLLMNLILVAVLLATSTTSHAANPTCVDTAVQLYTYDAMVEDMALIAAGHEDIMAYEPIATTSQGRNVWLIRFGNLWAENKILITASIHAREYMTSQLVMRMLEEYVTNYDTPNPAAITYRQQFDSVCLYILPMVNPDGVSISQFGVEGATNDTTKGWLQFWQIAGQNLTQIKANANGVDLNRNFPIGFDQGAAMTGIPSLKYYPGLAPLSEPETAAMAALLEKNNFVTCINFHSMGNVIYYGASTNTPEVAAGCQYMAVLVSALNGYRTSYCGNVIGSFADYFGTVEAAPSITIEIGTANPVPISQFTSIYNRNVAVIPTIAGLY